MKGSDELPCCGMIWQQFIDANIDEIANYCPICGVKIDKHQTTLEDF